VKVIDRIRKAANTWPWWVGRDGDTDRQVRVSRWIDRDTREDIIIVLDAAQRVECWSRWHTTRIGPIDYDNGKRQRLEDHLTGVIDQRERDVQAKVDAVYARIENQ